jgi:hypothetical protein
MTVAEIDALLTENGWTEDKATTGARISADDTGTEAWVHHSLIASYCQGAGQDLATSNMNGNSYMVDVFDVDTTGPPAATA